MQSALERRQQIIEAISDRRQDTMANLASEFGVSKMTIRRDIEYLTCSYPIFTVLGNGGGVRAMDGWYISRRYMRSEDEAVLRELLPGLQPDKQAAINRILTAFAKPQIPSSQNRKKI